VVASENDRIMSRGIDLEEIDAPDLVFDEQQMKGEDVDFFFDTEVCRIGDGQSPGTKHVIDLAKKWTNFLI